MRSQATHVRLSALQLAYLQEAGIEAALLRPYVVPQAPVVQQPVPPNVSPVAKARDKISHPQAKAMPRSAAATPNRVAPRAQVLPASAHRPVRLACQMAQGRLDMAANCLVVSETAAARQDAHTLVQGRAAQLLHAMLAAIQMQTKDTVFRFQAPSLQDEIQTQIRTLQPKCILALGRAAAAVLLQREDTLEALRGQIWSYQGTAGSAIPVIVTYPPGWLLAHPSHKADVWRDLLQLRSLSQYTSTAATEGRATTS